MHEKRWVLTPKEFKKQIVGRIGHDKLFSWANEKGIKRWVIETIEKGKIPAKHEHLVALADALNVTLDWLLIGEQPEGHMELPPEVEKLLAILDRGEPVDTAYLRGVIDTMYRKLEEKAKTVKRGT